MASDQEIATALNLDKIDAQAAPAKPADPIKKNLTGATFLAGLIRKQMADTKAQLAKAGQDMQTAMTDLQQVATAATDQVKAVQAETADLKAALGLNSNGESA
jgi:hypothetical protein